MDPDPDPSLKDRITVRFVYLRNTFAKDSKEIMDTLVRKRIYDDQSERYEEIMHVNKTSIDRFRSMYQKLPQRKESYRAFMCAIEGTATFKTGQEEYYRRLREPIEDNPMNTLEVHHWRDPQIPPPEWNLSASRTASGKTTTEAVSETPQPVPARSTALPSGIQEVTPHEGPPSSDSVAGGPLPTTFASEETDTAGQPVVPSLNDRVTVVAQPATSDPFNDEFVPSGSTHHRHPLVEVPGEPRRRNNSDGDPVDETGINQPLPRWAKITLGVVAGIGVAVPVSFFLIASIRPSFLQNGFKLSQNISWKGLNQSLEFHPPMSI